MHKLGYEHVTELSLFPIRSFDYAMAEKATICTHHINITLHSAYYDLTTSRSP